MSFKCNTVCFTIFGKDAEDDPESVLKNISDKCQFVIGQQECCPDSKRIHVQGMAWSREPSRWGFLKPNHIEKCQDPIKSVEYCSKEESRILGPWEFGTRPTWKVKGEKKKQQALKNVILIEKDIVDLVKDGDIPLTSVPSVIKAKNMYNMMNPGVPKQKEENEWIYGTAGCGKTRFVKENYDSLFNKAQNKWWDSYKGEDYVLLDDFDKQGTCLGHHLKIWGDRYFGFPAETKGGTITPNFKKFIITSNYTPEQLWGGEGGDMELVAAIERRFRVGWMDSRTGEIRWDREANPIINNE